MRALLLDRLPNIATANKVEHGRALNGVKVNDTAMAQALLKYGSYDVYYYIRESAGNLKEDAYEYRERLHSLDLGSLESLRNKAPDELVLFTSSHHLAKFIPFRQFCNRTEWPICGITHGLSTNTLIPAYVWNYFSATKSYDTIICTSQAGKNSFHRIFDGVAQSQSVNGIRNLRRPRTVCIPLGIEPPFCDRRKMSGDGSGFVVISIGRFSPSHKADLRPLLAGFLTASNLPRNSTLILAGDDSQYHMAQSLAEFAQSFPSANKVVVMPDVSASMKKSLLDTADVALCLSDTYQETFGLSVLDAMAAGLPVVAPDWDGYRDIVLPEKTGLLVATSVCEDTGYLNAVSMLIDPAFAFGQRVIVDIRGILDALALFASHRDLAREMGERGRTRARTCFSWQAIVPQYEKLWAEMIEDGKAMRETRPSATFGYLDYLEVFQDHPGKRVTLDARVKLAGGESPEHVERAALSYFTPPPVAGFSDALDAQILALCEEHETLTIRELVDACSSELTGPSMVITQVSRLLKYGLLRVLAEESQPSRTQEQDHEQFTDSSLRPVGI
jgi:D-inositol-3-phosphate glycosyltransferase